MELGSPQVLLARIFKVAINKSVYGHSALVDIQSVGSNISKEIVSSRVPARNSSSRSISDTYTALHI